MSARVYRCNGCRTGFAIFLKRGRENKHGGRSKDKSITCPLCGSTKNVEEVDPVETIGATLAKKGLAWWKSLPSGD